MSTAKLRTYSPTEDAVQIGVLWFDPASRAGDYTLPFVPRDADLKARLAYAIRQAREDIGLSRPQLAELVGVGRGAVNAWEKGESVPSLLNLGGLCDALQVEADLFAHPPAVPESSVARYRLRVEAAVDATDMEKEPRREAGAGG